ncbi:uncharacterized protein LOC127858877 [Dreissena polymorpha]|uniref:Uncharacterized protein n=1 Tax=Dreissena polymorpha TaxID=45954 RepID=A0A9D3Z4G3_DREPO|nr:uncharacterized protein LOC127858877 [Dreissena polymorpha]KAH3712633.1 hypothetical protein DPMN_072385 [Dreissena polymorpha]
MGAIEAIDDDPPYNGVIAADFALSAKTCTAKPVPSEDAKCSVVSKKKRLYDASKNGTATKAEPNDCIANVVNSPSMPDGGIYSVVKKKKATDGAIFGVCYNNEIPDDNNETGVLKNP